MELEKQLKKEIFKYLQYDAVSILMDNVEYWFNSAKMEIVKVYKCSIRVTSKMMGGLNDMLQTATERLGFKEPIDLYVVNDDSVNACAVQSFAPNQHHAIFLNSALVNKLSDDEILSVIGHEVGHLMERDA